MSFEAVDRSAPGASTGRSGAAELAVSYGDLTLLHRSRSSQLRLFVSSDHAPFVVPLNLEPACTIEWEAGSVRPPSGSPAADGGIWSTWRDTDGEVTVFYAFTERIPYQSLAFDPSYSRARVIRAPFPDKSELADVGEYPLSEFLACRLLARQGAVELHASTVVLDGAAYVFFGHSGAGKTTISRLAASVGGLVLSDDRTVLRIVNGRAWAWGTPWHGAGRFSAPGRAPVRGLYLLVKSEENQLIRLTAREAFRELAARQVLPRVALEEVDRALTAVGELVATVPVHELRFRPTPDVLLLVRAASGHP